MTAGGPAPMRRRRGALPGPRPLAGMAAALLLAGCSWLPGSRDAAVASLAAELPRHEVVLLGEVHDNAQGHRLRLQALTRAVRAGWRPAIAMEQFDRERQADLDRAMRTCTNADCVIQAAAPARTGWDWAHYRPVLELALREKLPVVAANLSRADAGTVMKQGPAALFDTDELRRLGLLSPAPDLLSAQRREVAEAHCGALPPSMLGGMAMAQLARDAVMAGTIANAARVPGASAPRPVVLLAGNGHTRRDIGVPRWLKPAAILSVGYTEQPAPPGAYDRDILIPPAPREDPCKAFQVPGR